MLVGVPTKRFDKESVARHFDRAVVGRVVDNDGVLRSDVGNQFSFVAPAGIGDPVVAQDLGCLFAAGIKLKELCDCGPGDRNSVLGPREVPFT